MSIGFAVALLGAASVSFGQLPTFQSQVFEVPRNFSGLSVNRSGMVAGFFTDQNTNAIRMAVWAPGVGLKQAASLAGDYFSSNRISDSGTIYGSNNGKVISWSYRAGRREVLSQAGKKFIVLNSSENDNLLLRANVAGVDRYFTYSAGAGVKEVTSKTLGFVPTMVAYDGTVYGNVPQASGNMFAKLNANGTTTIDSRSVPTYSQNQLTGGSQSQEFRFYPSGVNVVTTVNTLAMPGQTDTVKVQDYFAPNGTRFQLTLETLDTHVGGYRSGSAGYLFTPSGIAVGVGAEGGKMVFDAMHTDGVAADSSFVQDQFMFGNDQVLVGLQVVSGHQYYSITRIR